MDNLNFPEKKFDNKVLGYEKKYWITFLILFLISSTFLSINTLRHKTIKTEKENKTEKSSPQPVPETKPLSDYDDEDDYKGFIPSYIDMDKKGASILHTSRDLE
mgnify:CR=1 FL=1